MPATVTRDDPKLSEDQMLARITPFATKIAFFQQHGYTPHYHQLLFHTATNPDTHLLARYRSLAAGRRGGKTLSAGEEVAYYLEFPEEFHRHRFDKEDDRPLHGYALAETYKLIRAARMTFKETLQRHGLVFGRDVKERIADDMFEFANGSLIEFRSADNPDSLRGAGLDFLWMDEASFIRNELPYRAVRPALGDKLGMVINTTTPSVNPRNWFYDTFWDGRALVDPAHVRVSYWSLDNPHYPIEEWEAEKADTHPMVFAREYMSSFDSMQGNALSPEWLHYYTDKDIEGLDLEKYLGVDPAISQSPDADRFVISVIGIDRKTNQVYLLDQYAARIPFPEQVDAINRYWQENQPCFGVGVETVAYQAALAQQVVRLDDFIPVMDIPTKGKKHERILGMSPLFRAKRILIKKSQTDFIEEWLTYSVEDKHPHDDCLDSVEIALRTAGVLLTPIEPVEPTENSMLVRTMSSQEAADRRFTRMRQQSGDTDSRWAEFDSAI